LKEAGLGERKVVFNDKKGNSAYFQVVLEAKFPKLNTRGEFGTFTIKRQQMTA